MTHVIKLDNTINVTEKYADTNDQDRDVAQILSSELNALHIISKIEEKISQILQDKNTEVFHVTLMNPNGGDSVTIDSCKILTECVNFVINLFDIEAWDSKTSKKSVLIPSYSIKNFLC